MQNLQLSIPEPCHENWQQMTPTEQGRFCNACAKEVIDFSTMTDIQVLNYFTNLTHEKVCGRALPEQLDRTLSRPEHPKKKIFWYWNYIVMFLMFFTKGNNAKAQSCRTISGGAMVITAVDLDKIRQTNINNALAGKVGEVAVSNNRIITGKVTDKDGNPVSFASIKVKGTNVGVSADANGAYSLKVYSNTILIISSAGFKTIEVPIGYQVNLNSVLDKATSELGEMAIITVAGGMKRTTRCGTSTVKTIAASPSIIFKVKEDGTGLLINKAVISITGKRDNLFDKYFSDIHGICEFKHTTPNDNYFVKVEAEGYEPNEFAIDGADFKDRKEEWVVLLKKRTLTGQQLRQANINNALARKVTDKQVRSQSAANLGKETQIRMGGVVARDTSYKPIYVVDGLIEPNENSVNTDNIEDISFVNSAKATVLFGIKGANGAIVITTKKLPVKSLDTVTVTAYSNKVVGRLITTTCTTTSVMGAMIKGVTVKTNATDSLRMLANKITGAIKVYPNPVQEGEPFNVALKLKKAGLYLMQVTDATGRIVLQKQINANSSEYKEKIVPDSRWSSGAYYISIIDNKNKVVNKSSFIFR
jgi:hypothetical protein